MGAQDAQRNAAEIIPGVAPINALNRFVSGIQASINRQPTDQSRAAQARANAAMRRSRLAAQLQSDAVRAGRARLSENEINAHLATMGY